MPTWRRHPATLEAILALAGLAIDGKFVDGRDILGLVTFNEASSLDFAPATNVAQRAIAIDGCQHIRYGLYARASGQARHRTGRLTSRRTYGRQGSGSWRVRAGACRRGRHGGRGFNSEQRKHDSDSQLAAATDAAFAVSSLGLARSWLRRVDYRHVQFHATMRCRPLRWAPPSIRLARDGDLKRRVRPRDMWFGTPATSRAFI